MVVQKRGQKFTLKPGKLHENQTSLAANFHVLEIDIFVEESKMTKEYHKDT